ncbi:hypothetical protein [Nitrosomonas sp. Is37]|nr:hypothetical protein [Nitrosomonas sp. Is37]MDV6343062.1 hypothetical protein [Nitrosomonas sp. Is37]
MNTVSYPYTRQRRWRAARVECADGGGASFVLVTPSEHYPSFMNRESYD